MAGRLQLYLLRRNRPVAEAIDMGYTVDGQPGWSLVGSPASQYSVEALSGTSREGILKAVTRLYRENGLARAIINLHVGFILGGPVKFHAKDGRVQEVLDDFWYSDWNAWDLKLFRRVREWRIYGEQIWPVFVNPYDGFVEVSYISPTTVKGVQVDPYDIERQIELVLYSEDGVSDGKRYTIINPPVEEVAANVVELSGGRGMPIDGWCFFIRANALSDDPRGYSDLLPLADLFEALDDLLFTSVERATQQLSWQKHVKVRGDISDKEFLREIQRQFGQAKPGALAITNEAVDVEAVVPQLASAETAQEVATLAKVVSGSAGFPAAWLGFGDVQGRATLDNISGPTMKMLDSSRRELYHHLRLMFQFVIACAKRTGRLPIDVDDSFELEMPSIAEEDTREWARAIAQITTAAMIAHRSQFITLKTASEMVRRAVERIGITYDAEEEVQKRLKEPAPPPIGTGRVGGFQASPTEPLPSVVRQ